MGLPEILPSLDRLRLSVFTTGNHFDAIMLGVGAQTGLRISLRHCTRCRALPFDGLAPDPRQCRPALDQVGNRPERTRPGDRCQLASIAAQQYFCGAYLALIN